MKWFLGFLAGVSCGIVGTFGTAFVAYEMEKRKGARL
jgi:hypothetical protein